MTIGRDIVTLVGADAVPRTAIELQERWVNPEQQSELKAQLADQGTILMT